MERRQRDPLVVKKLYREDLEEEEGYNPYKRRYWHKKVYDREKQNYFGRTPERWCQLLIAYLILYGFIAIWCAVLFAVFYNHLSAEKPRWVSRQPTLSVAPCLGDDHVYNYCQFMRYWDDLPYIKQSLAVLRKYGDADNPPRDFGPCTRDNRFGYMDEPCFFLKINKIIGFKAETYERGAELPTYAPEALKNYIEVLEVPENLNRVWISCEPTNKTRDKMVKIDYFPEPSVDARLLTYEKIWEKKFSSYKNANKTVVEKEYKDDRKFYTNADFGRIIAVKISNLPEKRNVRINCFMWAKNILITKDTTHGLGKVVIILHVKKKDDVKDDDNEEKEEN